MVKITNKSKPEIIWPDHVGDEAYVAVNEAVVKTAIQQKALGKLKGWLCDACLGGGIVLQAISEKTKPMGTVIRKSARQEKMASKKPPMAGPIIKPSDTATPIIPRLRPNWFGGKFSLIIAGPMDIIMAAPIAWLNLENISQVRFIAEAHARDPMAKRKSPQEYSFL